MSARKLSLRQAQELERRLARKPARELARRLTPKLLRKLAPRLALFKSVDKGEIQVRLIFGNKDLKGGNSRA